MGINFFLIFKKCYVLYFYWLILGYFYYILLKSILLIVNNVLDFFICDNLFIVINVDLNIL
jgi:hypothetical protein